MSSVHFQYYGYFVVPALTFIVAYFVYSILYGKKLRFPPGPKGLPLIGTVAPLDRELLWNHKDLYGDVSTLKLFGTNIIILNTVDAVQDAFQSPGHAEFLNGRPEIFYGKYLSYPGVVFRSPHEDKWSKQRQTISTILTAHGEIVTDLERVISDELAVVNTILARKPHEDIDIMDTLTPSFMNIIIILLIGKRVDYDHEIMAIVRDIFHTGAELFAPANNFVLMKFPFLRHLPFGYGPKYRRVLELEERLNWFLFEESRRKLTEGNEECEGVVYDLLRKQQKSPWLTDDLIKGIIGDVFGGGNTTTKYTLYSLFLVLLHYPNVQEKIQSEIDEVIGSGREPSVSDRRSMPYTEATILEILRFVPVAPLGLPHMCVKDTEFRGYTIPTGTMIVANVWRMHAGDVWDEPGNFNPLRFLDEEGLLLPPTHPIRKQMIPFGVGRRHCIGEVFARNRLYLYITNILQSFNLKPPKDLPSCDPWHFICDQNLYPAPYKMRLENRLQAQLEAD